MKSILAIALMLTLLPGTSRAQAEGGSTAANIPRGTSYVYKTSAGQERRMEIYIPPKHDPNTSRVPGLILFHGGNWTHGDLTQFGVACAYFASRGLVCATVDYQMLSQEAAAKLPAGGSNKRVCIMDAKSAIRWFKEHAGELGVDPNRVIAGGGSAGGHISALATLNPGLNDPEDKQETDVSVVSYLWFNPAFAPTDASDAEIEILQHLPKKMPPAIVFFGDKDSWKRGWDAVHAKLKEQGTTSMEVLLAPGEAHGFFNKAPWRTLTLNAADEFLVKQGLLAGKPTLTARASGDKLKAEAAPRAAGIEERKRPAGKAPPTP